MSNKTKSTIALLVCAFVVLTMGAIVFLVSHLQSKTVFHASGNTEDSPIFDKGFIAVDWIYWTSINPDIIGWVQVPDTHINAPIVQARPESPQYYREHDVYGNYTPYGAIYLDSECINEGLSSKNSVIFGHNMGWDQTMFGDFEYYVDVSFLRNHQDIYLQTPEWKKKISVNFVSIIQGGDYQKRTVFADESDFISWYEEKLSKATVTLIETIEEVNQDSVYTFCTCSYYYWENERTLVYAA